MDFSLCELRSACCKPQLGLGHVRLGDFADVETVTTLPQLFLEHHDVAFVELEHGGITQEVHVDRRPV